jgi:A/G-specific adenine glycosylase
LARFKAVPGWPGNSNVNKELWLLSAHYTPTARAADYTQAMMDLGATICTRSKPACHACPLKDNCLARMTDNIAAFPAPKPAKSLPVKQRVFLLLRNNLNQVLLEKRPPAGIWGGLWSLPEFDSIDAATAWCLARNMPIINQKLMTMRRHTFSHYHLDFTPLIIQTDNPINIVMEANQTVWYKAEQIHNLGIAAPIKLLLQQQSTIEDNDD